VIFLSPLSRSLAAITFAVACLAVARGTDDLARQFAAPPDAARPWVWAHWLHGNVNREGITRDLEAIKRVGLGGVTMFDVAQAAIPPGPHAYFSPSWQELFAHQIAEAKRLGLGVMSQNGPGYSGNGGPWITPEFAAQKLVESATRVTGGRRFSGTLPQPPLNGNFYRDVAVLALRETDAQANYRLADLDLKRLVWLNFVKWIGTRSAPLNAVAPSEVCIPRDAVIDLTGRMSAAGALEWDAPPGTWTILRFGHTWTGQKTLPAPPEGQGPECDKLDPRGIRTHFDHVMKRMIALAGPAAGQTFASFFVDSWEAGGQNWTEKMPQEFRRRRGYDLTPFLPVMTGRVLGDLQTSERFLYDLRQTVSELVTENFWAEMQRLCHAHGMKIAVQPYITTGNDLDAANFTDEPMGEFWTAGNTTTDYAITVKAAASAANLNGKVVVGVEAFTANHTERWLSHPATLKAQADRIFALGANRFQIHRFAMQRFAQLTPGMMMGGWGQQYDRTQTWWEWSKPWHNYLARCQFMLRRGPVVTDVLAVVPEEPLYRFEPKTIPGYDYDACGPDTFKRITVTDGLAGLPGGPRYRLITVDHTGTMTLGRLQQLTALVQRGANLLGEPPLATPGLADLPHADEALKKLAAELWGTTGEKERTVGQGRVFRDLSPEAVLQKLAVPRDFTGPATVSWIHRRDDHADIYFLASPSEQSINATCSFRIHGRRAELWDPATGTIRPLATVTSDATHTTAQIPLGPRGSVFVVFRSDAAAEPAREDRVVVDDTHFATFAALAGPWTLSFPPDSGAPASSTLTSLDSWSRHPDDRVKYFSGTADYRTDFSAPPTSPQSRTILDLGRVEVMARVHLNGQDLGILWRPPYRLDVTDALRPGTNSLRISVVNLWVNRLIGDESLPADSEREKNGRLKSWPQWALDGKSSPTGRHTFVTFPLWKKGEPLVDSGLLGPVTLFQSRSSPPKTSRP
jgi:hypothetical protein